MLGNLIISYKVLQDPWAMHFIYSFIFQEASPEPSATITLFSMQTEGVTAQGNGIITHLLHVRECMCWRGKNKQKEGSTDVKNCPFQVPTAYLPLHRN